MKKTKKARIVLAATAVVIATVAPRTPGFAQRRAIAATGHLYHVKISVDFFYAGVEVNAFFPNKLTIHAGDSVQWTNQRGPRPQTVTFGPVLNTPELIPSASNLEINPLIVKPQGSTTISGSSLDVFSSGALMTGIKGIPNSYTFTFPNPGTYLYRSLFHPGSLGEVDVVTKDKPASPDPPDTGPSYYAALRSTDKILNLLRPQERNNGTTGLSNAQVEIGGGEGNISLTKFSPEGLTVRAGSTITWLIRETSGDPHDLLFGNGASVPMYTKLANDGGLLFNPLFAKPTLPSGSTVTTDTMKLGTWQSGILYGSSPNYPSAVPSSYSLTFAIPARIDYVDPFIANGVGSIEIVP